jgi:hypothetical protein
LGKAETGIHLRKLRKELKHRLGTVDAVHADHVSVRGAQAVPGVDQQSSIREAPFRVQASEQITRTVMQRMLTSSAMRSSSRSRNVSSSTTRAPPSSSAPDLLAEDLRAIDAPLSRLLRVMPAARRLRRRERRGPFAHRGQSAPRTN